MTEGTASQIVPDNNQEDGEIIDDNSADELEKNEVEQFTGNARKIVEEYDSDEADFSDEDEPPEEILNMIASKGVKAEEEEQVDPTLCRICKSEPHKYKCPKCNIRTCSLACSKKHKEDKECDGVRGPYTTVQKLSQYTDSNSIEDQKFLTHVQQKFQQESTKSSVPNCSSLEPTSMKREQAFTQENEPIEGGEDHSSNAVELNADGTRSRACNAIERFLLPNAARRHIWLSFSAEKGEDCSRHEQFSDSIFWCIDFIFKKQMEDGSVSDYTYRVQNIPETIRICTVLRQFLSPRKYGCIVSESDLDVQKLEPFINATSENINLFMKVPRYEKDRYYVVMADKNMLDNTRNRVILDHPKIIVVLNNEFLDYQVLTEAESFEIRERMQNERNAIIKQNSARGRGGHRGGHRGDSNGFRGGRGRGGFRGGSNNFDNRRGGFNNRGQNNSGPKRSWNGQNEYDNGMKRGRGRVFRGQHRHNDDAFDPFEPFEGPVSLPMDYGTESKSDHKHDISNHQASKADGCGNSVAGFHSTSNEVYQPHSSGSIFD